MQKPPLAGCLLATLIATQLAVASVAAGDADTANLAVADEHIVPAYQALQEQTAALDAAAQAGCLAPDGRSQMQNAFASAFLAWQDIQHIRFGPVQYLSRDFRFQMWPDKRGSVGKHLARLLASGDPAALETATFASGSVAVQGFSALERLLYGSEGGGREWQCQVINAITNNLQQMATDTLVGWTTGDESHHRMFATAGDGNALYDSAGELSGKLLNSLHTQLELVIDRKLRRPLDDNMAKARPKRAEAWRSGLSLPAITRNIEALRALYRVGFARILGDKALDARIEAGFESALATAAGIGLPLHEAVKDDAQRQQLERLLADLERLAQDIGRELTSALGLSLGFNSLDGD
ncbi:MAG: imelysin family protein [Gammaproteobacteria bacterium]|nr:imelysin family protein [Gammaproteobacteria bacterium]